MASKVSGIIEKINDGGTTHSIASTAYGYCETAANQAAKVVDMTGFKLYEGITIHVKFQYENTASNPTLNVNSTGAKPIVQYGNTAAGTISETDGWYAGAVVAFTYDGTSWVRDQGFNTNSNTDTKVTQTINTITTGTDLYPLLLSYYKTTESTTTAQTVQRDNDIYAQPSTGLVGASKYFVNNHVILEYNSTDSSLDFVFI